MHIEREIVVRPLTTMFFYFFLQFLPAAYTANISEHFRDNYNYIVISTGTNATSQKCHAENERIQITNTESNENEPHFILCETIRMYVVKKKQSGRFIVILHCA